MVKPCKLVLYFKSLRRGCFVRLRQCLQILSPRLISMRSLLKRMQYPYAFHQQRGSALLTALLITALAAALAAEVATEEGWLMTAAKWSRGAEQAQTAIAYAQQRAIAEVLQLAQKDPKYEIHQVSTKVQSLGTFHGVQLSMQLQDAQSLWNINALGYRTFPGAPLTSMGQDFSRLLQVATQDVKLSSTSQPSAFTAKQADLVTRFIMHYIGPYQGDRADRYYVKHQPPLFPAHQMMMHISQLRAIRGVTRDLYLQVSPILTALPTTRNLLNVNDLTDRQQLLAIALGISPDQISGWNQCLATLGLITSTQQLRKRLQTFCPQIYGSKTGTSGGASSQQQTLSQHIVGDAQGGAQGSQTQLGCDTNYIFVRIQAKIDTQVLHSQMLLYIQQSYGSQVIVHEVWKAASLTPM